ncbi:MAG TPA: hypothetical protein P5081_19630 [Phycisphaerae bacterium]|nr:hypothetical protein [Phycisphaerae bacterium]HRW55088.1 hypothetical protein [Phycisphaerae bacterium]
MTQFPSHPPAPDSDASTTDDTGPASTSKLAIAALVFSLLVCIPYAAPLIGAILAAVALISIAGANGRLRGRGITITALVLSLIVLAVDIGGMLYVVHRTRVMLVSTVRGFIERLEADDLEGARARMTQSVSDAVSDDELREFEAWIKENCGTLENTKLDDQGRAYSMGLEKPRNSEANNPPKNAMVNEPALEFVFDKGVFFGAPSMTIDTSRITTKHFFDFATLDRLVILNGDEQFRFPAEE